MCRLANGFGGKFNFHERGFQATGKGAFVAKHHFSGIWNSLRRDNLLTESAASICLRSGGSIRRPVRPRCAASRELSKRGHHSLVTPIPVQYRLILNPE